MLIAFHLSVKTLIKIQQLKKKRFNETVKRLQMEMNEDLQDFFD